jgi:hypothetical protein
MCALRADRDANAAVAVLHARALDAGHRALRFKAEGNWAGFLQAVLDMEWALTIALQRIDDVVGDLRDSGDNRPAEVSASHLASRVVGRLLGEAGSRRA